MAAASSAPEPKHLEVPGLAYAYGSVIAMLIVPQFVLIHPYLHLLIMAPLLVWIGCQRSLLQMAKAPEDSQVEMVSKKDAMQFPLIGSAVLFGLYIVVKLVKKEYLDMLISFYFLCIGVFGVFGAVQQPLTELMGCTELAKRSVCIHWQLWKAKEEREPIAFSFSKADAAIFALCAALSAAYAHTKLWWLNNCLGCAFSISGIEMLALGSYPIGCILLCGLFVYDVFWVFGTEVMVSVAKGINAPIKILFPKALGVKPMPLSMLGLGDIVIPGIFVALLLRFDHKMQLKSQTYFHVQVRVISLTVSTFFLSTPSPPHLHPISTPSLTPSLTRLSRFPRLFSCVPPPHMAHTALSPTRFPHHGSFFFTRISIFVIFSTFETHSLSLSSSHTHVDARVRGRPRCHGWCDARL